jgi:hypothetical protein
VTADEALAAAAGRRSREGREPSARNDAVKFLRQVLAEGPISVEEAQHLAVEVGLLGSTTPIGDSKPFREARQVLGIMSTKTGMRDGWSWSLPVCPGAEDAFRNPKASSGAEGAFGRSGSGLILGQQATVAFERAEENRKRAARRWRTKRRSTARPCPAGWGRTAVTGNCAVSRSGPTSSASTGASASAPSRKGKMIAYNQDVVDQWFLALELEAMGIDLVRAAECVLDNYSRAYREAGTPLKGDNALQASHAEGALGEYSLLH